MDPQLQPEKPARLVLARFQCVGSALQQLCEVRAKLAATGVRADAELAERLVPIASELQAVRDALMRAMDDLGLSTKWTPAERARLLLSGLPKAERLGLCAALIRDAGGTEADGIAELLDALAGRNEHPVTEEGERV